MIAPGGLIEHRSEDMRANRGNRDGEHRRVVASAAPALAGPLAASPERPSLSTPAGTTTTATLTFTNTGGEDVELNGAFPDLKAVPHARGRP